MTTILQSGPAICSSSEVDQASQYLTGVFDMKLIAGSLLSPLLCTAFVFAQTYQPPPHFNHIVIIVQENRTPDNIFGSSPSLGCGQEDPFETGVDIQNGGKNIASQNHGGPYITCSQALSGLNGGGGNHHHDFDWTNQYDGGAMDGACIHYYNGSGYPTCPPYTFVTKEVVQPYFDIATNYGFANYMFQTNEGPSFPAHQFLFGGTSAPVWPGDSYYQYFVAENPSSISGCPVGSAGAEWIDPGGNELNDQNKSECYDRNTLVTFQDANGVVWDKTAQNNIPGGWKYYAVSPGKIWDAPESDPQTCYFATSGSGGCTSAEFTSHVVFPQTVALKSAPIFSDIQSCQPAAISWVTPDEAWSDHPGDDPRSLGPSWVADIVNAVGNSACTDSNGDTYWQDTAIFITWDDWGGFYDHVPPPAVYEGDENNDNGNVRSKTTYLTVGDAVTCTDFVCRC